jgi:hypothetical protein
VEDPPLEEVMRALFSEGEAARTELARAKTAEP